MGSETIGLKCIAGGQNRFYGQEMKKFFMLSMIATTLCAFDGFAASNPVTIQCDVTGPVFQGILNFDMDPRNWAVIESCQEGSGALNHPSLSLLFNGIEYVSNSGKVAVLYRNDCAGDVAYFTDSIQLMSPSSGFEATLSIRYDSNSKNGSVTVEELSSGTRHCSVRVN